MKFSIYLHRRVFVMNINNVWLKKAPFLELWYFEDNFCYFYTITYLVGTLMRFLFEAISVSTHKICSGANLITLDKKSIRKKKFLFLHKNFCYEYSLDELLTLLGVFLALLTGTNNICFCGEIRKNINTFSLKKKNAMNNGQKL